MASCCPAGHGCNAPSGDEPCALSVCRAAAGYDADAAAALARWRAFEKAGDRERRFRRRAFQRARDRALITLALAPEGPRRRPLAA